MSILANLLVFGHVLREVGLEVHQGRLMDAMRALAMTDIRKRDDVRMALQALLVHRREDVALFNCVFEVFFRRRQESALTLPLPSFVELPRVAAKPVAGISAGELRDLASDSAEAATVAFGAYSATTVSRTKDFAEFTPAELERARLLLMSFPWRLGRRRTRRWKRASGTTIDLRRLLRRGLMRGDFVELPRRRHRSAPRPIVLIGDVSGSMERYSRVLLHFVYGLAQSTRHVESFVFATQLTRLTHRVASRGAEPALARVTRAVKDWGGGTRIGETLRTFNTSWARRVMRNGPVVIIVSDGWDRGDPELLARELARLRRSCRRLIWLNPLLGSANYEPLTRGMQAALKHVNDFLPAHNLASLEQLAAHLRALPGVRGRVSHAWSAYRS